MTDPYRILLVCMGNICRSPMAQEILRHQLGKAGAGSFVEVSSAGFLARGRPASHSAEVVMRERGLELTKHLSRTVTDQLVAEQNLVLAMEEDQARELQSMAPKEIVVDSLIHYATKHERRGDIFDPYGEPLPVYRRVADELERLLTKVVERLHDEAVF